MPAESAICPFGRDEVISRRRVRGEGALLLAEVQAGEDLADALHLFLDVLAVLVARQPESRPALLGERVRPRLVLRRGFHGLDELGLLGLGDAGGTEDAAPVGE